MSLQVEEPGPPAPGPRRRRIVLGLLTTVAVLASGATVAVVTTRGHDVAPSKPSTQRTPAPAAADTTPDAAGLRVQALQALLQTRSRAVLAHDQATWMSTVDPDSRDFRQQQATVFANLRAVPFSDWSYTYAGVAAAPSASRQARLAGPSWVARVQAGYRLAGYDRASSLTEQFLTLVERHGQWYVGSTSDGQTVPQPWDLGRVRVVKGSRVLVLGTTSTATLKEYASAGDRAVQQVSQVWGDAWPRKAVLVVPRTEKEMGRLLQRPPDGLSQIAAVTTGELSEGDHGVARSDRVVINPAAFQRLGPSGRRVVLAHEMTHVAVRSSTTAPVPIWLSEGFADEVGYRDVGLSPRTIAADVLALVRRGKGPRELPGTDDFDPTKTTIAPAYSGAWLACRLIVDTYGERDLVRLYRAVATTPVGKDGPDPDAATKAAFEKVLGTSVASFTAAWRDNLRALAGS
ncbi:MAG TPA: hypothetical protein VFL94_00895 [Actinomycetales bacterium]|nr:hypothetical protein [Actinomycetales bacterium]